MARVRDGLTAKFLHAGVLTGILLWAFTAAAPRHGVQAQTPAPAVPAASQRAEAAEVQRREAAARQARPAAEAERRHKLAAGQRPRAARPEERARQDHVARQKAQEEARRREEARQRERARQEAVRKAQAAAARQVQAGAQHKTQAEARVASARRSAPQQAEASLDDLQLLARMVEIEAGNEPFQGKVAVAAVILNRVRSPRFPDSIRAVIYQPGQFPTAADRIPRTRPGSSELQAAREALAGADPSNGALFFYNPARHPCEGEAARGDFFCSLEVTARIGNHVFAR
ncbi:cell wall hydrolase SleB [Thermaerobacter marianensis DSM 12885]|uniref:Cell wall hydrolase SleB n=1 Tax=Thermaerobacter marianensis (strain ATCC 700841 / DSM 12885 / JCM 10246 / 7p75a) TaxID=644966 RepID=E6SJK9_THEM7|nr:cell wall hydrolase [Thermaerobacter marianensis]ADU52164.1 cell wall hydrolase SleB [Thermaerobacter marianensis DSM 12885]